MSWSGIYKIEFHGGSFGEGKKDAHYDSNSKSFSFPKKGSWFNETIKVHNIESLEIADEESIKKMGATFGWGLAGLVVAGPLGMAAGLLGGGKAKKTTFLCVLKDKRKFLGTIDSKGFVKLQGAII